MVDPIQHRCLHGCLCVLDWIMSHFAGLHTLNGLSQEDFGKVRQLRLPAPIAGEVINDAGVNHIRVHHFHGVQIRVEGLPYKNGIGRKYPTQIGLDVLETSCDVSQHRLSDAGVLRQVVADWIVRFHQSVVNDLEHDEEMALND